MPGNTAALRLCAALLRRLAAAAFAGAVLLHPAAPADAAEDADAATLELIPSTVTAATIEWPEAIQARLRLRAPATATLRDISITSFSNDGIAVTVDGSAGLANLAPDDEHLWSVTLTPNRLLAKKAQVIFEVAFTTDPTEDGKASVQRHVSAALAIEPPAAEALASLVTMAIKGDEVIISRQRPSSVYLVLKNQRDFAVEVTDIQWFGPGFILLRGDATDCTSEDTPPAPATARSLPAHGQAVLPLLVCPEEQIVPGKYNLLATAKVTMDGRTLAVLDASQAVQVGVLGESDLLNLLGVPSLLLLPGFLFLVTLRVLRAAFAPAAEGAFDLKPKEADFWAVAIALSLAFAFLYPWATERMVPEGRRDYLIAYGLRDLVYVYTAAIILGIAAFAVWRFFAWVAALLRARELARCMPHTNDGAVAILEKIVRAKAGIDLPVTHLKGTPEDRKVYVLYPWTSAETVWVTPAVLLKMKARFDDRDESRAAYNALQRLTTDEKLDAATALQLVKQGQANGWWTVDWAEAGAIAGPVTKAPDAIEPAEKRERLVKEA